MGFLDLEALAAPATTQVSTGHHYTAARPWAPAEGSASIPDKEKPVCPQGSVWHHPITHVAKSPLQRLSRHKRCRRNAGSKTRGTGLSSNSSVAEKGASVRCPWSWGHRNLPAFSTHSQETGQKDPPSIHKRSREEQLKPASQGTCPASTSPLHAPSLLELE